VPKFAYYYIKYYYALSILFYEYIIYGFFKTLILADLRFQQIVGPSDCPTDKNLYNQVPLMVIPYFGDKMGVVIFSIDNEHKGKIRGITSDDLISRQSITQREASALGIEEETQIVIIEGDDSALDRARELFKDIGKEQDEAKTNEILEKIKEDEEGAAEGVGFIFGD
jgi:hypothetical protein